MTVIDPGPQVAVPPEPNAGAGCQTILHITAPAAYGGLERVLTTLAAAQSAAGMAVHVAVLTNGDVADDFCAELRAALAFVHVVKLPGRAYVRERRELIRLCRRIRPGVVHTHGYHADIIGGAAARAARVPTVSTVHGFTGGDWRNRFYESLQRKCLRHFDAVVAVSRPLAAQLLAEGVPLERLHVFPNAWSGGPNGLSAAEARAQLGLQPDRRHVGWVGRLSPEKGCDLAVDAMATLSDPRVVLSIIGDGPERAALARRAARLGIENRIVWHGAISQASRYFPAFDAFVLSSRTEGTPIVLFEAMAARVPVICTAVGGVPDVVSDDEALLVPSESADALAWGINETLFADPEHAAARASCAETRLRLDFAAEPWFSGYRSLYHSLRRPRSIDS